MALRELPAWCDGPLGLSYERCEELNPRIIYVSATGYGPDGPHAAKPGQDVLIEARTGWGQLYSVDGRPVPVASAEADTLGAMNGAFGTACAIVHAVRTGEGQRVRTSRYESATAGMAEWEFHFLNAPRVNPNGHGRDMRAHNGSGLVLACKGCNAIGTRECSRCPVGVCHVLKFCHGVVTSGAKRGGTGGDAPRRAMHGGGSRDVRGTGGNGLR